jgi:hypothetical protein
MHACSLGVFSSIYLHAWRRETGSYLLAQAGVIPAGAKPATNQPVDVHTRVCVNDNESRCYCNSSRPFTKHYFLL